MTKCIICDQRPALAEDGFCDTCQDRITASIRKPEQAVKFATYRGIVIGFYRNGGKALVPRLVKRAPGNLPKGKTIDLNTYIEGFTRQQVKKIKATILQLGNN